jgi:hypothetical protein
VRWDAGDEVRPSVPPGDRGQLHELASRLGAMTRAVASAGYVRRLVALAGAAGLLVSALGTAPAWAQELPACPPDAPPTECQLPAWAGAAQAEVPSPFGSVEGLVWLADPAADAPADVPDLRAIGIGRVDIADAGPLRDLEGLLKLGKAKQAVRPGPNVLIRVVLERPLAETAAGHASIHVATDRDRSRSNNAPAGVNAGPQPFAGLEDVASVAYASTTGQTTLLDSDLASGWYGDADPFAAAWASPTVLDVLLRPEAVGDSVSVVTYANGPDGGYDTLGLDGGPIPLDGAVGLRPACLEASLTAGPFVVRRLEEGGQVLRDVETPAAWVGGATLVPDAASLEALRAWVASTDDDGDGLVSLRADVNLFDDGEVIGQRPQLWLALEDEGAQLGLQLGITRRGYEVLRAVDLEATGEAVVDAWLAQAVEAMVEAMPPFRSGRQVGDIVGDGVGSCAPALAGIWSRSDGSPGTMVASPGPSPADGGMAIGTAPPSGPPV